MQLMNVEREREKKNHRNCESSFIFNQNETLPAKRTQEWQLACTKYKSHGLELNMTGNGAVYLSFSLLASVRAAD